MNSLHRNEFIRGNPYLYSIICSIHYIKMMYKYEAYDEPTLLFPKTLEES